MQIVKSQPVLLKKTMNRDFYVKSGNTDLVLGSQLTFCHFVR